MPARIDPKAWCPVDLQLEPAADTILRSVRNTSVIAGPGAGKTELLAQRAAYLLQTGICPTPRRILAISFKRDAARNLRERVEKRCGPDVSRRLESYTFDAFAKGIVDRFLLGLPTPWRPAPDYKIDYLADRDLREFLNTFGDGSLRGLNTREFWGQHFWPTALPANGGPTVAQRAVLALWRRMLDGTPTLLDFPMIGRLAELILRMNPKILRALRLSYSHVFLDEFQDTTAVQYDLAKTAFMGSRTVLSAVGDDKQRIMGWAGALPDAFERFHNDFNAEPTYLLMNYRSAPELVRMQSYLIASLDPEAPAPTAHDDGSTGNGECRIYTFQSEQREAQFVAELISERLRAGIKPRDVSVLVKQRPALYTGSLVESLRDNYGIKARDEATYQDLLTEPLTQALLVFLKIATSRVAGKGWGAAVDIVCAAHNVDMERDERRARAVEKLIRKHSRIVKTMLSDPVNSEADLLNILQHIMTFVGEPAFRAENPQYRQGGFYDAVMAECAKLLFSGYQRLNDWTSAVSDFEGADSVPIMTVHKSKGLEYDTVIFVGLEDSAFFSFRTQPDADRRAFFVAFSRAKKHVYFTFSRIRELNRGRERQSRQMIGELYGLLQQAGVQVMEIA